MGNINMVIGSWGSYNECNERALGSNWLDLSKYDSWDEIEEELKNEGFKLDGIDEELFVQDIEGLDDGNNNWDYTNPQTLFETLYESGVLKDDYKYKVLSAYLEVENLSDFYSRVESLGSDWSDGIYFYQDYDFADYGRMVVEECGYELPDNLEPYFDYEAYGESFKYGNLNEVTNGLIEICN